MNLNQDLGSVLRTLTAAWPSVLRDRYFDPWYPFVRAPILRTSHVKFCS